MGMECCYENTNIKNIPSESLKWYVANNNNNKNTNAGFSSFTINNNNMIVNYYNQAGEVLYTTPSISPRK